MARVPITVMGFRCERCGHEWVPRDVDQEPRVCPKCKSPYWNRPRRSAPMTYEQFRDKVARTIRDADRGLTWTEIGRPPASPNVPEQSVGPSDGAGYRPLES